MNNTITIEKVGRRFYIIGDTYPIKDEIREAGCRWDKERRAWWTGKADIASSFEGAPTQEESDYKSCLVCGVALYKGRRYYAASNRDGDTIISRSGKILLYFRDGSSKFWAVRSEVRFERDYSRPRSIASLIEYAESQSRHEYNATGDYCGHICPVAGHRCSPSAGPCHDCA